MSSRYPAGASIGWASPSPVWHGPAADISTWLLESFTSHTVVKIADLQRELATVRERGWACVAEELEVGLNAVAAPVYDANARVIAALSVSGPSYRLGLERFEEIAKQTISAADAISRRLGWVERG